MADLNSFQIYIDESTKVGSANIKIGQNQVTDLEEDLNELTNRTNTNSSNIGTNSAAIEGVRIEVGKLQTALGDGFSSPDKTVRKEVDSIKSTIGDNFSPNNTVRMEVDDIKSNSLWKATAKKEDSNSIKGLILDENNDGGNYASISSVIIGGQSNIADNVSFIVGDFNEAHNYSIALGKQNSSISKYSSTIALGINNIIQHNESIAIGRDLSISYEGISLGRSNIDYENASNLILTIGAGSDDDHRINALEVVKDPNQNEESYVGINNFGPILEGKHPNDKMATKYTNGTEKPTTYFKFSWGELNTNGLSDGMLIPSIPNSCALGVSTAPFKQVYGTDVYAERIHGNGNDVHYTSPLDFQQNGYKSSYSQSVEITNPRYGCVYCISYVPDGAPQNIGLDFIMLAYQVVSEEEISYLNCESVSGSFFAKRNESTGSYTISTSMSLSELSVIPLFDLPLHFQSVG